MIKKDFLKMTAEKAGLTIKDTEKVYDAIFETIRKNIKKDKISISEFGTFSVVNTKERMGRNPQTGKQIKIKASKKVKFTPAKSFKENIKK